MSGKKHGGEIVHFPPLPQVSPPPFLPVDGRQTHTAGIISAIADAAANEMHLAGPNLTSGFHASAVDLGRLQTVLAHGIGRLDMTQVEARWDEVFEWMRRALAIWVQRCKRMRIERKETGIRFELETQDDLGYYEYKFDVFPPSA